MDLLISNAILSLLFNYNNLTIYNNRDECINIISKLNSMGYENDEIEKFSQEKFNYLSSLEIIDNVSVEKSFSTIESSSSSYSLKEKNDSNTICNGKFTIVSNITTYRDDSSIKKVKVIEKVYWPEAPSKCYNDLTIIQYPSYFYIPVDQSSVSISTSYKNQHYLHREGPDIPYVHEDEEIIVNNQYVGQEALENCNIKMGDYIAFQYKLPKTVPETQWRYGNYYTKYYDIMKDIRIVLEANFNASFDNVIGGNFITYYAHSTENISIDLSSISFTTAAPYISVNVDVNKKSCFETERIIFSVDMSNLEVSSC